MTLSRVAVANNIMVNDGVILAEHVTWNPRQARLYFCARRMPDAGWSEPGRGFRRGRSGDPGPNCTVTAGVSRGPPIPAGIPRDFVDAGTSPA